MTNIVAEKAKVDIGLKLNPLWREYITSPCKKYCYLIIAKNGSNTYRKALRNHNWCSHRFDMGAEHYIAHMGDPYERWIKGFAEFCLTNDMDVAEILKSETFLIPGVFDNHTMPISHIWCDYFYKIKFFKLGGTGLEDFIREDYDIQNLQNLHVATQDKIDSYNLIRDAIKSKQPVMASLFYHDLLKWNNLK